MNGLEATSIIKRDHPETSVVILTMHSEPSLVKAVINYGANGYLLKNADRHEFIDALLKVAEGKSYFSPELTRSLVSEGAKSSPFLTSNPSLLLSKLTEREIEVLRLIAEGLSNKEIGDQLFISHRTVDTHRTNLMKKLDIHNIAGLIKFAFGNGLVDS
jgi:two-component system response regulator NreC